LLLAQVPCVVLIGEDLVICFIFLIACHKE
jgi:hypothetical protein